MNPVVIGLLAAALFLGLFAILLAVLFRLWAVNEREQIWREINDLSRQRWQSVNVEGE